MLNKKFVFAVSLVAMMAVSNAWASAPATDETVSTKHSVFTAYTPTEKGSKAGIAGVTYVNRAVNSAGNAATAAEIHAAASGAYAIDAKTAAEQANSAAAAAQAAAAAAQATASEGVTKANAAQQAIADMDLASVGAGGSYIKTVSQEDGKVTAVAEAADATPTADSKNMVTSGGVYAELAKKENSANKVTALSADSTDAQYPSAKLVYTELAKKQNKLTIDSALSPTSTNPVQTKVVDTALGTKENASNKVTGDTFATDDETRKEQYPSVYSTFAIANTVSAASKAELSGVIEGLDDRVTANEDVIDTLGTLAYEDTVTSALITDDAVTSDKIADKTIVNADVADNAAIAASKIAGLATVATSGSYSDLSDKPDINNATLTIKKNGTSVGTFTANASVNNEINITVPTTVASLTDAGSYATVTAMNEADAKKVNVAQETENAIMTTDASGNVAPVAIVDAGSGTYVTDVVVDAGKVTLSRANGPTVNNATLTIKKNGTSVGTFTANASANKEIDINVPTTVASLTDAGSYATVAAMNAADAKKVSIAQGTTNAGKGLVVDAISGDLTLTDVATQAELDAVSSVANAAQTAGQVSSAISTAIGNLDGNAETTGTNDGKYVTAVTQADGKITPLVVAFDTTMSSSSTNAVQNMVVNTALGTKENVSNKETGDTYTSGDTTKYPSIKTAEAIANTAVSATKSGLESLTERVTANEDVIDTLGTLAYEDTVTSALITDGAVTAVKTSGVIGKIPSGSATASTYADIWVE